MELRAVAMQRLTDQTMNAWHELQPLLRYAAIGYGLDAISLLRSFHLLPSMMQNGMIFTLHHVRPAETVQPFSPNAILSITPEFLEQAVQSVLAAGMIPVHVHQLPELLAHNHDKKRYVCFTLDDGYRDNMEYASPIFERYNIPYTIYITAQFAEHRRIIWWEVTEKLLREQDQIVFDFGKGETRIPLHNVRSKNRAFRQFARYVDTCKEEVAVAAIDRLARQYGLDPLQITREQIIPVPELIKLADKGRSEALLHFGAHTLRHLNLRRLDTDELVKEISGSKDWFETVIGISPQSFAFPYGWQSAVSNKACAVVQNAGFKIAVTTQPGMLSSANTKKLYAVPRVSLNGMFQKKRYVKALISGLPFIFDRT
jgi:peptidoglycan/xylan/chitin deacetylase (PgdA/CDA1 family)